jgi:hypothetical protein
MADPGGDVHGRDDATVIEHDPADLAVGVPATTTAPASIAASPTIGSTVATGTASSSDGHDSSIAFPPLLRWLDLNTTPQLSPSQASSSMLLNGHGLP